MPLDVEPPVDQHEFLDWVFDRAMECLEDGRVHAADELLSFRPALEEEVRELIDLARRVAFGPKDAQPELPGYRLLEKIGEGGMGTVWLARQEKLGARLVAVKILHRSLGFSPRQRSRFRTEAQAIAKLRHPNIVDVYDVIEGEGGQAYAMEWVEGSTLARVIDRMRESHASAHGLDSRMKQVREALGASSAGSAAPLDRSYIVFACRVGVAIGRALAEVHRAGLVHRDVKPSNILLRRDGTPLLSDFGLVRDPDSSMATQAEGPGGRTFAGTVVYAAPEQLRADGGMIDGRADIYALGATLYMSLALRVPFHGDDAREVLHHIQAGFATPLRKANPKAPKDLQTIVAKSMEADPARRYQTADDMADDLDRLLNLQPIKARPAGWLSRTAKLARRNRASLAAAFLGGSLAILLVALALTYFIGFPAWSKARLDEARLTLLDPEQGDALFSAVFWKRPSASGLPITPAVADRALEHYDDALRFAPFNDDVALERDLVRLAREITRRSSPAAVVMPRPDLALTCSLAAAVDASWNDFNVERHNPTFEANDLTSASIDDLRGLGLLALLCGEPLTAMAAWEAQDLRGHSDPMVEACFGIAYLIEEQYGRAYPRLRNAVEAFPNVGFLTVYLAEAAAQCGDIEKAQHWLDAARSMPRLDQFNGLKRVQAAIHDFAGRDSDARRLYEELLAENRNVVAFYHYARFLEARNELEPALLVYLRLLSHGTELLEARSRFVAVTERWWAELGEVDRQSLAQAKDDPPEWPHGRQSILKRYGESLRVLAVEPAPDGLPPARP